MSRQKQLGTINILMEKKLKKDFMCIEIILNSKRQVMGKLGHVVPIRIILPFDVNLMLNLSNNIKPPMCRVSSVGD